MSMIFETPCRWNSILTLLKVPVPYSARLSSILSSSAHLNVFRCYTRTALLVMIEGTCESTRTVSFNIEVQIIPVYRARSDLPGVFPENKFLNHQRPSEILLVGS